MVFKAAPLNSGFLAISILGLIGSLLYVYPSSPPWGAAFFILFFCMLIASFISMNEATPDYQLK
ncbi:hypothetical protein HZA97_07365 [Candidatus Woesearchaeota archaeon]|nr:hypothetical protein [Candidatus Woesearchaeota archaeon]